MSAPKAIRASCDVDIVLADGADPDEAVALLKAGLQHALGRFPISSGVVVGTAVTNARALTDEEIAEEEYLA